MASATHLFSRHLRGCWAFLLLLTVALELLPMPPLPAACVYTYVACKAILFLALGCMTPLTFWAFDSLGYGALFSAATAATVEILQSLSAGHRARLYEFLAKLVLLMAGFALALNLRYDGLLRVGRFHRQLVNPHEKH